MSESVQLAWFVGQEAEIKLWAPMRVNVARFFLPRLAARDRCYRCALCVRVNGIDNDCGAGLCT